MLRNRALSKRSNAFGSSSSIAELAQLRQRGPDESTSRPVDLGNPGEFTICGLAEEVARLTGSGSPLVLMKNSSELASPPKVHAHSQGSCFPLLELPFAVDHCVNLNTVAR